MLTVIVQMAGLIACGVVWRVFKPGGIEPLQTRKVLTTLVYYLLLPALVLSVLWQADLGAHSVYIALSAASGIVAGLGLGYVTCRFCQSQRAQTGAMLLAVAFPNATYLGLPVLEATFGNWARSIAIQYDLFACTPLLFTVGILTAARFGTGKIGGRRLFGELFRIPAVWAALLAILLNLMDFTIPLVVDGLLSLLNRGVVPLMLFSLGLSLEWKPNRLRFLRPLIPVIVLRLLVIPVVVMLVATALGFTGEWRAAVVMEAAMPSMVIGIIICDRYDLDVSLYATAVTVTTVISLVTLPLWYRWLV
ncbi:MAG: AEC family transporter [Gammaproteobacteria bacterium]|jgi:predicted permease